LWLHAGAYGRNLVNVDFFILKNPLLMLLGTFALFIFWVLFFKNGENLLPKI
jgi:hypothetical protein